MIHRSILLLTTLLLAGTTRAHFTFVVPDPGGATAKVIMSETLTPEKEVDVSIIGGTRLTIRDKDGKQKPLTLVKGQDLYTIDTPGTGTRVIRGITDLGVMQRGEGARPHHLIYHVKTIIGDAFDASLAAPAQVPVELIPVGRPGAVQLELRANGKLLSDSEVAVIRPDGEEERINTGPDGRTKVFTLSGRYAAWARFWVEQSGETGGKSFTQVRHYATLVFDAVVPGAAGPATAPTASSGSNAAPSMLPVETLPPLPQAVASFGAVGADGQIYIYGGHLATRHDYSTTSVSGAFHRAPIASPSKWESLPGGPTVQGMNLAAHRGMVYRVGGMQPRNAPGQPADNISIADVARFDPVRNVWEPLPSTPQPRSSHDVLVIGDKLYVVGGWSMLGKDNETVWSDTVYVLDLASPTPEWKSIKQPFKRRALIAAPLGDRLFVIGGMDADDDLSPSVDILDTRTGTWSKGPNLPGDSLNAFAPAACSVNGRLYVSIGSGDFLRLNEDGTAWECVAKTTPRIVHRLIPDGNRILILGGASGRTMQNLVEAVTVAAAP